MCRLSADRFLPVSGDLRAAPADQRTACSSSRRLPPPYVIEPPAWGSRVLAAGETLIFSPGADRQGAAGTAADHPRLAARARARRRHAGDGTADLRPRRALQ
jgi:hypothetical protein